LKPYRSVNFHTRLTRDSLIQVISVVFGVMQINLMKKTKEFYYHRYDAIPVHIKTIIRPVINGLYFLRFSRSLWYHRSFARIVPNPRYVIPRNLGFAKIDFQPNELIYKAVDSANKILINHKQISTKITGKSYLRTIANISDFDPEDPIVQIAMNSELLSCVAKYLGVAPQLNSINVMWSPALEINKAEYGSWTGSQLFHIDGDSDGIVKIWILCNQVDEDNGPTVLIPADKSLKISKDISYSPKGKVKDDTPFISVMPEAFRAVGEPGTMFATDTARCFHQGSRTKINSERLVIMYYFDTFRSSWYLSDYQRPTLNRSNKWSLFISNLPNHKKNLFRMLK